MPFYQSTCLACQTRHEFFCKIDDRDNTPVCCNQPTSRNVAAPMVPVMGIADHYKITGGDGRTYYGRHEYEKYLKANDLLPSSDLKGEAEHQRKQIDKETQRIKDTQLQQVIQKHY